MRINDCCDGISRANGSETDKVAIPFAANTNRFQVRSFAICVELVNRTTSENFVEERGTVNRIERNSRIDDLQYAVECSKDAIATIWEYSVSLDQLTIRITWTGSSENLHFVCNGCERMEMNASWGKLNFSLQEDDSGFFCMQDREARFFLECKSIRVFRNVEPIFYLN